MFVFDIFVNGNWIDTGWQ